MTCNGTIVQKLTTDFPNQTLYWIAKTRRAIDKKRMLLYWLCLMKCVLYEGAIDNSWLMNSSIRITRFRNWITHYGKEKKICHWCPVEDRKLIKNRPTSSIVNMEIIFDSIKYNDSEHIFTLNHYKCNN